MFKRDGSAAAATGEQPRITHEPDSFLESEKTSRPPDSDPTARDTFPRGMEERKEPVLFKFTKPGDMIEGYIAGFLRTMIEGKPAVAIFIAVNGNTAQFAKIHATRQLLEKLRTPDTGKKVRITYQGENREIKTAGNPMRIFSVLVDTKAEPRTDLLMDTSLQEFLQDES